MKKLYFLFSLLMATVIGLSSCESDDSLTNEPPAQEYIDKAKEILGNPQRRHRTLYQSHYERRGQDSIGERLPNQIQLLMAGRRDDGA